MKKLIFLAMASIGISAYGLPTYEPFTEFGPLVAAGGSNMVCTLGGTVLPQATSGTVGVTDKAVGLYDKRLSQMIDFTAGGLADPSGEAWTTLNFAGTNDSGVAANGSLTTNLFTGLDVAIIQDTNRQVFPNSGLAGILPATFPGFPAASAAITNMLENPAQPLLWAGTNLVESPIMVGNSAVLNLSQDVTRPTNGFKTVYVSYLFSLQASAQLGAGNQGRYLAFICQSNMTAGVKSASSYTYWAQLFNTFNTTTAPRVAYHGVLQQALNTRFYLGACDSSAGRCWTTAPFYTNYNTPIFVVGEYQMSAAGADTNFLWADPDPASFGGTAPPTAKVQSFKMINALPDIAGLAFISRTGNGASGGLGTNFIANLMVGTTWSYVTGGPEFTNQPVNDDIVSDGATVTFSAGAVAAGQSVNYQWLHIVGGTTNLLTDGVGTAGGSATVSGSRTGTLTLAGVSIGDRAGIYQLMATASSTGYSLNSASGAILLDPVINPNPVNVTANYGGTATFTASATTAAPSLSYQWYFGSTPLVDGVNGDGSSVTGSSGTIIGSTLTTTLRVSNVTYLEAGNYSVVVTNNVGNANVSTPASLTVNDPIIVSQPNQIPLVLAIGGTGTVSVVAIGTGVTYQWYGVTHGQLSNAGEFSGVTTATLTIANITAGDADTYYCVVSGPSTQTVTSLSEPVYVESTALGPFNQNDWPLTYAPNATVDFAVWDPGWIGAFPGSPWANIMSLALPNAGDQTFNSTLITIGGGQGYQMTGSYLCIADPNWRNYTNVPVIDILLNVYGNGTMLDANGTPLATTLREGQAPSFVDYVHEGTWPQGANNGQWNWVLLSFTNPIDGNGYRYVGDPTVSSTGGAYGGVNGATVSLYGAGAGFGPVPFIVRAVAMGPHGAFGSTNQINRFAAPANCSPEPTNNLAWVDFNLGTSNNLSVLNNPSIGETYTVASGVGPSGDQRTAILPSALMEMPILNNYLGLSCNENLTMQVSLEVYDDPALAGFSFGPTTYATDYQGDKAVYAGPAYTLTGSGKWIKVCFFVGPLNLDGVNTAPLTGGPIIQFNGNAPYIDRVEVGLIRTGTNALAGQIPDPDYHLNPFICGTNYGYFAQWNPTAGVTTNVVPADGFSTTLAGPVGNQMICEQPNPAGGGFYYEDWKLTNSVFGPNYQDNADVVMNVTYYDDPAFTGVGITNVLAPNVYSTMVDGSVGLISPTAPYGQALIFQGSGKWQTAQFELPDVNFSQSLTTEQHVCRFASSVPVYISSVQFNVLRPCGNFEGIDYLQAVGTSITNQSSLNFSWRGQASVVGSPVLQGVYTPVVSFTNTVQNTYSLPVTNGTEFFRLGIPAYPAGLPGDAPPSSVP